VEEPVKTRMFAAFGIAALVFGLAGSAQAQYEANDRSPIGVRMSFYKPFSDPISDIKSIWMAPGLDYNGKFDSLDRPQFTASIAWLAESNETTSCKIIPIGVQFIKYANDSYPSRYVGLGATAYFINYRQWKWFSGWRSDNRKKLGVSVSYGIDFGSWYVEGTYQISEKMGLAYGGDLKMDGAGISIGTRRAL